MVAQITEGSAFDKRGLPFRRRNFLPGICVAVALGLVTTVIWFVALDTKADVRAAAVCNPPPAPADPAQPTPNLGQQVPRTDMTDVAPATLTATQIRVLNASGRGGQAAEVAGALRDLGFAPPTADNDAAYANVALNCGGQIRFGPGGRAAAATVWLVAPCVELYQDARTDDSVDLAIGSGFNALTLSDDIEAVLAGLRPDATEPADSTLLSKIHSEAC